MMVIYILIGIIVMQSVIHLIERRDLYSRLMCRDLKDLNASKNGKALKAPVSRHKEVLNKWRMGGDKE